MSTLNDDDRENLSAYLDGELDDALTQELEAKLARDPEARKEADALRQAWNMLDYLPKPEASPSFTHRTMEKLSLISSQGGSLSKPLAARRSSHWIRWSVGILTALFLGAGLGAYLWLPDDLPGDLEDPLVRHLRAIEKYKLYEPIDDVDFLKSLDRPDLFGDDPVGS